MPTFHEKMFNSKKTKCFDILRHDEIEAKAQLSARYESDFQITTSSKKSKNRSRYVKTYGPSYVKFVKWLNFNGQSFIKFENAFAVS